jgi:hypothetical protein
MMNPEQREQARISLLRIMTVNPTKYGLPGRYLKNATAAEGMRLTEAEIESEMLYLTDKGLAEETTKILSPENQTWRITAAGRDYLATLGI